MEVDVDGNTRNAPIWLTWLLITAGVACAVVAVVYFVRPASGLPSFFPGHDVTLSRHHTTHGIGMLVLAALCGVGAWLTSGTSKPRVHR
jgi:hypothetical protein